MGVIEREMQLLPLKDDIRQSIETAMCDIWHKKRERAGNAFNLQKCVWFCLARRPKSGLERETSFHFAHKPALFYPPLLTLTHFDGSMCEAAAAAANELEELDFLCARDLLLSLINF
jgi:hypothetical protein